MHKLASSHLLKKKYANNLYIKKVTKKTNEIQFDFKFVATSTKGTVNIFPPKNKDAFVITDTSGTKLSDLIKVSNITHNASKLSDIMEGSQPLGIGYKSSDSICFTLHFANPVVNIINIIEGYDNYNSTTGNFFHFMNIHIDKGIYQYIEDNNAIAIGCKAYNYMVEADYEKAIEMFSKCASVNGQCSYQIAQIYRNFLKEKSNKEMVIKYLEQSLALGYSQAHLTLSYAYNELALEQTTEQNFISYEKKSYENTLKAIHNGQDEAYFQLSYIYAKGVVVPQDFTKAKEYLNILEQKKWNIKGTLEELDKYIEFDKLCKLGDKNAIIEFYQYSWWKQRLVNPFKNIKYLKTIASNTNPKALYYLSYIYKELNNTEESKKYAKQFVASAITFEDPRIDNAWSANHAFYILYDLHDEWIKYSTALIAYETSSKPLKADDVKKIDIGNGKVQLYWHSPKGIKVIDTVAVEDASDLRWWADPFMLSEYYQIRGDAYKAKGMFNEAIQDYLQYQEHHLNSVVVADMEIVDGDGYREIALIYNLLGDNINSEKYVNKYLTIKTATQVNHTFDDGERVEYDKIGYLKHGKYKYYYSSGKLYIESSFFLGQQNGKKTYYNENGSVQKVENYLNDMAHGIWVSYYLNGQKENEKKYDKGKPIETWKGYSNTGEVTNEQVYLDGKLTTEKSYDGGSVVLIKTLIGENLYDVKKYWKGSKNVFSEGKELNGKNIDKLTYYNIKGEVSAVLKHDMQGNSIGENIWYYDNGVVRYKKNYADDGLSYKEFTYYPNAKNKSVGEYKTLTPYKNYEKHGLWKGYYVNGNVMYEGNFSMGIGKMQRYKDPSEESYWKPYIDDNTIALGYAMLELEKAKGFFSDNEPYEILDKIIEDVKSKVTLKSSYTKTEATEIMNAIGETLQSMGYIYDNNHIDYYNICLKNKVMDCDIYACTYVTVADKLELPVNLVYAPSHAFVKWNSPDVNFYWECTANKEMSFEGYKDWLLFRDYQVNSGAYMRPLTRKEQIGHAYILLANNASYDEAINYYLTAINLSEKNYYAYFGLASKLPFEEKEFYLEKAIDLVQSDFDLAFLSAKFYSDNYSKSILFCLKAIDEYKNYLSSDEQNEKKLEYFHIMNDLYFMYKETNDKENAIKWGEQYIWENPTGYSVESIKKDIYALKNPPKN